MYLFPVWEIVLTFMAYFAVNWWHPVLAWSGSVSPRGSWSLFWINTEAQIRDCSRSNEVYLSLSPWETNQHVCFSHKLWSRLEKAYFLEEKSEVENLSPFCIAVWELGEPQFLEGVNMARSVLSAQKRTCLVGWRRKPGSFSSKYPELEKLGLWVVPVLASQATLKVQNRSPSTQSPCRVIIFLQKLS